MIDFYKDPEYNRKVKVVYEKDRIIYKLYQDNVTIYIGEVKNGNVGNEVRDHDDADKRPGEVSRS
jgi:hypothetical protein